MAMATSEASDVTVIWYVPAAGTDAVSSAEPA